MAAVACWATMQSAPSGLSIEKSIPAAPSDPGHRGMEASGVGVPDRDSSTHGKARGRLDRDLLLAEVSVDSKDRDRRAGLAQDRIVLAAAQGHVGTQVQRIAHQVLALADLHDAPAQTRDVIDCGLERPVVGPDQIGTNSSHRDRGPIPHLGMHGVWQLLLVGFWGDVVGLGDRTGAV